MTCVHAPACNSLGLKKRKITYKAAVSENNPNKKYNVWLMNKPINARAKYVESK